MKKKEIAAYFERELKKRGVTKEVMENIQKNRITPIDTRVVIPVFKSLDFKN